MKSEIIHGCWLAWQSKQSISLRGRSQGDMLFPRLFCLYSQVCDSVHKRPKGRQAITHGFQIGPNCIFCSNVVWGKWTQKTFFNARRGFCGRWSRRVNTTYLPSQSKHNGAQKVRYKSEPKSHRGVLAIIVCTSLQNIPDTFQTMNEWTDE